MSRLLFDCPTKVLFGLFVCLLGLGCCRALHASPLPAPQLTIESKQTDEGLQSIYRMTVTPAAEPVPALRHRLMVMPHETKPGNYATYYLRSHGENSVQGHIDLLDDLFGKNEAYEQLKIPLAEMDMEKLKQFDKSFEAYVKNHLRRATLCRDTDWGLEEEDLRGVETYEFLLPSVQNTRSVSRMLALRARIAIAEGRYEDAIETFKMNLKLARTVSEMKFLVADLVGIAEVGIGNQALADLIAAKDSPNLYWAIAEIPNPCIDIRDAMQLEMSFMLRLFPDLEDAETAVRSKEGWNRVYRNMFKGLHELRGLTGGSSFPEIGLLTVPLALTSYSAAKDRLIERGMSRDDVEKMAVGQVLMIDTRHEILLLANDVEKSLYVPAEAIKAFENAVEDRLYTDQPFENLGRAIGSMLLPATYQIRSAQLMIESQLRAFQVVEAIRMHVADTGELPKTIDEIKIVPVPLNPGTGKKFVYWLDGDTAVIDIPFSDGYHQAFRFMIQVAK